MIRWLFKTTLAGTSVVGFSLFAHFGLAAEEVTAESSPAIIASSTNEKWYLRLPQDGHVAFRGVVSMDQAGTSSSSIMYPAPNVAGLLAAVITHGLLVEAAKKEQKNQLQITADNVLSPYRGVLDTFNSRDLMRRAVDKTSANAKAILIESDAHPEQAMIVESMPIFSLAQDQKTIILDNTINIHMPGSASAPTYQSTARIISTAKDVANPAEFWTANDGEKLKDESAQLVAESFDIAFHYAASGMEKSGGAYQTIRYREGSVEKFERAQMLSNRCNRLLIRSLRGTLMSVPTSQVATDTSAPDLCDSSHTQN